MRCRSDDHLCTVKVTPFSTNQAVGLSGKVPQAIKADRDRSSMPLPQGPHTCHPVLRNRSGSQRCSAELIAASWRCQKTPSQTTPRPISSGALLLQMQLYAPVELEGIFLRQPVAVGDRERLLSPFRHQRQLASVPCLAQKAGDRLKPLT